jgi:hypothetical protein
MNAMIKDGIFTIASVLIAMILWQLFVQKIFTGDSYDEAGMNS